MEKEKSMDEILGFLPEEVRKNIKNDILEAFNKEDKESKYVSSVELTIMGRYFSFSKMNMEILLRHS